MHTQRPKKLKNARENELKFLDTQWKNFSTVFQQFKIICF